MWCVCACDFECICMCVCVYVRVCLCWIQSKNDTAHRGIIIFKQTHSITLRDLHQATHKTKSTIIVSSPLVNFSPFSPLHATKLNGFITCFTYLRFHFFPLIYLNMYDFFLILHFAFKYFDDGSELRRFHRLQIFLVKKLEKCFILFRHRFLFVMKHKQTIERIFQKPSVAKRKFKKNWIYVLILWFGFQNWWKRKCSLI